MISKNIFNQLIGRVPSIWDLKDEYEFYYNTYREYQKFKIEGNPDIIASLDQYFVVNDHKGEEVAICPDGDKKLVTSDNFEEWMKLVIKFKLNTEILT